MNTNKTPGRGKAAKEGPARAANSVRVNAGAFRQLTASADKLDITNGEYASAAIAYFAATGLDPTKEQTVGLASVASKVDKETLAVRAQNVEIGNRLISIIRGWEKNLYTFMQQQQQTTYGYLEQIESNILQHQVMVETNLLAPMVEQLFKANLESFITRSFTTQLFVKSANLPAGSAEKQMELTTNSRDEQLAIQMREFLKTNTMPQPKPTPRRAVTPVPAKPVAPVSAAPEPQPKP